MRYVNVETLVAAEVGCLLTTAVLSSPVEPFLFLTNLAIGGLITAVLWFIVMLTIERRSGRRARIGG